MRIRDILLGVLVGVSLLAAPVYAFDGSKSDDAAASATPLTPTEAFRSGTQWLKAGEAAKAVHALEYAAEKGHALAQWKLGRMYAEDGRYRDAFPLGV